ncbi:MAG: TIGR00282 family metallophosphoesterase [Syntrophomonadaceae bacterium]|nr:TIGR00282 family metallophosphoesterase [Syntrophomonadaceae bacterium]MDH7497910.1 TIGR00282 family metallophosphoesterase [Syntrophomonadaceae bacterium]
MRVLFVGDIVGRPGRRAVASLVPRIVRERQVDFVIANGENAAGGKGITATAVDEIIGAGVDVITMGNHVWDNREVFSFIDDEPRLIRPANYPGDCPGQGSHVYTAGGGVRVGIINLSGRVFMAPLDDPFRMADLLVEDLSHRCDIIIVDFHAEATSEKQAMGWYLDGRVHAVLGTHTHVQTSDERILPQGTAYITDVGMTGPADSVLGMERGQALARFLTQRPQRLEVAKGRSQLDAVLLSFDDRTWKAESIERLRFWTEA